MKMNKSAALIALVLLPVLASTAIAGIEPSPWKPRLGVLHSIVNCLSEVNQRVNAAVTRMGIGPSPFRPLVNKLEAQANQLDVLRSRLDGVLADLEGQEVNEEVRMALQDVRDIAQPIARAAELALVGGPWPEDLVSALEKVRDSALAIGGQNLPSVSASE